MTFDPQTLSDNELTLAARGKDFTPGPWRTQKGDSVVFVVANNGASIAATTMKSYYQSADETDKANARLMSAAPDLLYVAELLIEFNKGNPHPEDENGWAFVAHHMIARAQEAIAKAIGQ